MTTNELITKLELAKEQNGELTIDDAVYLAKEFAAAQLRILQGKTFKSEARDNVLALIAAELDQAIEALTPES